MAQATFEERLDGISIGSITIRVYDEDSVWIENDDGEGMQVENETLQDALIKFFEEQYT